VWGLEFVRAQGSWFRVKGSGFRALGVWCRIQGFTHRVWTGAQLQPPLAPATRLKPIPAVTSFLVNHRSFYTLALQHRSVVTFAVE